MDTKTLKRLGLIAVGLGIILAASGCVEQKPTIIGPGETPGVTPTETGAPAPQQIGGISEGDITSSESDLAQIESLLNDMTAENNITIEDLPS